MGWEFSEISSHVYIMVAMGTAFSVFFFFCNMTLHTVQHDIHIGQTLTTTLRFTVCACAEGSVWGGEGGGRGGRERRKEREEERGVEECEARGVPVSGHSG